MKKEDTSHDEVVEETVEETPETPESEPSERQEEPQQEEKPRIYAGKYKSPEELEKAYQEAQKLISQQGAKIKEKELPPDKQAIINELKELGVVTKDDLDRQKSIQDMKMKDDLEIRSLTLTESQESALRRYAAHPENHSKSMTELWDELTGTIGGKVISKKTTIKPKSGSKTGFVKKTTEELAKLQKADYDKYWIDYAANQQAG